VPLTGAGAVAEAMRGLAEAARAAGYDHTVVLDSSITAMNATTAMLRAHMSRRRADGAELERLTVSYVVALRGGECKMAALLRHTG
jgi:hypothetical protein